MLRGLIIRQVFILVDLALSVLILSVSYLVLSKILVPPSDDPLARVDGGPSGGVDIPIAPPLGPLDQYKEILTNGLFGKAANPAPGPETPTEAPPAPEEKTTLPLRLIGTAAANPVDPLGTAVIENTGTKVADTFYLGQPVVAGVVLVEVYPRKVILRNDTANKREVLEMTEESSEAVAGGPPPLPGRAKPGPGGPVNSVVIKRDDIVKEFTENATELLTTASPEMYVDEQGKVAGVTSRNLSKIPLAAKAGLQDGDVVQSVNGVAIDSEEKMLEVVQRFGSVNLFRLSVLRDGKPMVINFRLE